MKKQTTSAPHNEQASHTNDVTFFLAEPSELVLKEIKSTLSEQLHNMWLYFYISYPGITTVSYVINPLD